MLWDTIQSINLPEHEHEMYLRRSAEKKGDIRVSLILHLPFGAYVVLTNT